MKTVLYFLTLYAALHAALLAVSLGIAFLLRQLMPTMDIGMAALIGLISTIATVTFFGRLARFAMLGPDWNVGNDEEDEEEGEDEEYEPPRRQRRTGRRRGR